MLFRRWADLSLLGLAALAGAACATTEPVEGTATVEVRLNHAPLHAPVGDAEVEVDYQADGMEPASLSGRTRADGRVRFAVPAPAWIDRIRVRPPAGAELLEDEIGQAIVPGSALYKGFVFPTSPGTSGGELSLTVPDAGSGEVRVRLRWQHDGEAVAGIPVRARFVPVGGELAFEADALSDDRGELIFRLPAPSRLDSLRALPTATTPDALLHPYDAILDGVGLAYTLLLPEPGSLSGRLVGPDGAGLAGVEVRAWSRFDLPLLHALLSRPVDRVERTGPDGRFRFDGVGRGLVLYAATEDFALPGPIAMDCSGGRHRDLAELPMRPLRTLRGRLARVDDSGVAQAGVWIHQSVAEPPSPSPWANWITESVPRYVLTDADGRFQAQVLAGIGGSLATEHTEFAADGLDFGPYDDELKLRMYQPRVLEGRVTDPGGRPLAASLRMSGQERSLVRTDSRGRFRLPLRKVEPFARQAGEAAYRIQVEAAGFARHQLLLDQLPLHPEPLELELEAPQELRVRVLDESGRPVPGARIQIRRPLIEPTAPGDPSALEAAWRALHRHPESHWTEDALRTDALGRLRSEGWPAGRWLLKVGPAQHAPRSWYGIAEAGGPELVVVLNRS